MIYRPLVLLRVKFLLELIRRFKLKQIRLKLTKPKTKLKTGPVRLLPPNPKLPSKLKPKLTEKSGLLKEEFNQFVFEVDPKANKVQIKESVEKAFKVEVEKVRTMNVTGKKKRLGRHQGKKSNWKKALITLKEGQTIEYFEGA